MTYKEKNFLLEQLEWCQKQELLFIQIEQKLHEMRCIAKYALDEHLTKWEREELNMQFQQLREEVSKLEMKLSAKVH